MDAANPQMWLAWAGFGVYLCWLLARRFWPLLAAETAPAAAPPALLPAAWLVCEEGTALDLRARWFSLRAGGATLVGHRPRADTAEAAYCFLAAEDLRDEHACLRFNAAAGHYELEALAPGVTHNNEPVPARAHADLADGDTLDLGRITRFRFTLSGPEDE